MFKSVLPVQQILELFEIIWECSFWLYNCSVDAGCCGFDRCYQELWCNFRDNSDPIESKIDPYIIIAFKYDVVNIIVLADDDSVSEKKKLKHWILFAMKYCEMSYLFLCWQANEYTVGNNINFYYFIAHQCQKNRIVLILGSRRFRT